MEITVHKPFRLMQKDGTPKQFGVGVHDVTDDVASHWYVQAHAEVDKEELAANQAEAALRAAEAEQTAANAGVVAAAAAVPASKKAKAEAAAATAGAAT